MVETFWPTVGTVLSFGSGAWGRKSDLTCSWKVVLPALSRPRGMTEYSAKGGQPASQPPGAITRRGARGGGMRELRNTTCLLCSSRTGTSPWRGGTLFQLLPCLRSRLLSDEPCAVPHLGGELGTSRSTSASSPVVSSRVVGESRDVAGFRVLKEVPGGLDDGGRAGVDSPQVASIRRWTSYGRFPLLLRVLAGPRGRWATGGQDALSV